MHLRAGRVLFNQGRIMGKKQFGSGAKSIIGNVAGRPQCADGNNGGPILCRRIPAPTVSKPESLQYSYRVNPYFELLQHIERTRVIGVAIINETDDKIDSNTLNQVQSAMPLMTMRLGTSHVRFKYRLLDNWAALNKERALGENVSDVGVNDVAVSISYDQGPVDLIDRSIAVADNTRVDGPSKPALPFKSRGYKVSVYIPDLLLQAISKDALVFVDQIKPDEDVMATHNSKLSYKERVSIINSTNRSLPQSQESRNMAVIDSVYNKNRDRISQIKLINGGLVHLGFQQSNAIKALKQRAWISKTIKGVSHFANDIDLFELTYGRRISPNLKGIGTAGNLIATMVIVDKAKNNNITGSTWIDIGFLTAGIIAALFTATEAVIIVGAVATAYQLLDMLVGVISDKSLSDLWDAYFPANRPFSLPITNFYVPQNR